MSVPTLELAGPVPACASPAVPDPNPVLDRGGDCASGSGRGWQESTLEVGRGHVWMGDGKREEPGREEWQRPSLVENSSSNRHVPEGGSI